MSKAPPGVKRVVAIINFFAEHPGQSFTFTDIVKALDLGRATCHAWLAGLVEAQYLYRNADKTYVIGPALAAIGKIANEQFSPLQVTQPELRALSDRFRADAAAVRREQADVVIELRAGSGKSQSWSLQAGQRLPLRAPFAGVFFATAKSYEIDKWLDQLSPRHTEAEKEDFFAGVEFMKRHGFMFGEYNPGVDLNPETPELLFTGKKAAYPVTVSRQLDPRSDYNLAFMEAPVFNRELEVEFVIVLSGFRENMSGTAIREMGEQLRRAAERITYFMNGRVKDYPLPVS